MFLSVMRKAAGRVHHELVQALFRIFDRILPVRDDYWCFCTWDDYPHTMDNPRAIFEEVKNDASIRKIILQKAPGHVAADGAGVVFVPVESVVGAYFLARSRVILMGYALRGLASFSRWIHPPRHQVIQLWHGIPLKRIGQLFQGETFWAEETPRYAAAVCSSQRDQQVMAGAFSPLPVERIWLTGLPRNDLICKKEEVLPPDYREQLDELDRALKGRRMVLYAPTWRKQVDALYRFSDEEERVLEQVLEKHGAVLAIRGHPNVRQAETGATARNGSSIISANDLPEANLILRRTDVLITDYSSIYIDYLILNRPIIHFAYDLEAYVEERGFLYELEEAFGGPCTRTFDELLGALDSALADPDHGGAQRAMSHELFHDHGEHPSAEVVSRIRALGHT